MEPQITQITQIENALPCAEMMMRRSGSWFHYLLMSILRTRRDSETYAVIGAALQVHRQLGAGFLEAVYHEALALALSAAGIPFASEVLFPIRFNGQFLKTGYRADFVCYEHLVVEIKALPTVTDIERAQVINYLKASRLTRALLLNFGTPSLGYYRFVLTKNSTCVGAD